MKNKKFVKKNKYTIIAISIALVLVVTGIGVVKADISFWDKVAQYTGLNIAEKVDVPDLEDITLGAFPGPDVYNRMYFHEGFQSGGLLKATTTTETSYTLGIGDLTENVSFYSIDPGATTTITTMASSTVAMDAMNIPDAGDMREVLVYNEATVAEDIAITLAAGTGVDLQKNEDTADLAIAPLSVAKLTFIRLENTDVMIILDQWDPAD